MHSCHIVTRDDRVRFCRIVDTCDFLSALRMVLLCDGEGLKTYISPSRCIGNWISPSRVFGPYVLYICASAALPWIVRSLVLITPPRLWSCFFTVSHVSRP